MNPEFGNMATFLFDKIIFGPVMSRRLGVSLGINLLPVDAKLCSFDCIYCECGRNPASGRKNNIFPSREEVREKLKEKLILLQQEQRLPDVITFAGNGEPTLHPRFTGIIDDTLVLRKQYAPSARVAVLSNATMLWQPEVFSALLKVDDNIQKLDSAYESTLRILNCPGKKFSLPEVVEQLASFQGKVIIQTMFVRGTYQGNIIDNTLDHEIGAWISLLKRINPSMVMIYTIARNTPTDTLEKILVGQLNMIARRVKSEGFKVQVSG